MTIFSTLEGRSAEPISEDALFGLTFVTADLSRTAESVHGIAVAKYKDGQPSILFSRYFGPLPATTQEYDNIPEHRIEREKSLSYAMNELAAALNRVKVNCDGAAPLFFSTNVSAWTRPLLTSLLDQFPQYQSCFGSTLCQQV